MNKSTILRINLALASTIIAASALAQQPQTLSISQLQPQQRTAIFSKIAEQFYVMPNGEFIQVKKTQPKQLSSTLEYQRVFESSKVTTYEEVAYDDQLTEKGLVEVHSIVSQAVGGDKYLVDRSSVLIEVPNNDSLVEGNSIVGFAKYVGPYDYTTVTGAARRVHHLRLVDIAHPTEQQLVEKLNSGATFQMATPTMLKCPQCGGLGTVRNNPQDHLQRGTCDVCDGSKKIAGGKLTIITK